MRPLLRICIPLVLLAPALLPLAPARAAGQPAATMSLLRQSGWNGPGRPLMLSVRATNNSGSALTRISLSLSIYQPPSGPIQYEQSLSNDVTSFTGVSKAFVERGRLAPGQSQTFRLRQPVDQLASLGGSALYPVKVDLLSNLQIVATLRTPMIYLTQRPTPPLSLIWSWVLSEPLQVQPGGAFGPGPIEADIAPGGRLYQEVRALSTLRATHVDVVVSSVLLDELDRMSHGYRVVRGSTTVRVPAGAAGARDAQAMLSALQAISGRVRTEVSTVPFADPVLPALVNGGLARDVHPLFQRGRELARQALGSKVATAILRPPGSEFDARTLSKVARLGTRGLLVDGLAGTQLTTLGTTPSPLVKLTSGGQNATAIVPDARIAAALDGRRPRGEEVLAAHAVLGELAAVYFQAPSVPGTEAMIFPERPPERPGFFVPFASLIRSSSWIRTLTATRALASVPVGAPQPPPSSPNRSFTSDYVRRLLSARGSLRQFASAVRAQPALVERMATDLQFAEGGAAAEDEAVGAGFVSAVSAQIHRTFSQISGPPDGYKVTLTSLREGHNLPITVRNDSGFPVRLIVRLVGPRQLAFANSTKQVYIPAHAPQLVYFSVRAQTTGRFPVEIRLLAPDGAIIAKSQMIVRSTIYNRVALVLTIGAALFLLIWWGRRFLPRPTS